MPTLTFVYGLAGRTKPIHSDAAAPFIYGIDRVTAEETVNYSTARGYQRHVAELRNNLARDGHRIIAETVLPNGRTFVVYMPRYSRGPHAMPSFVIYPPSEI